MRKSKSYNRVDKQNHLFIMEDLKLTELTHKEMEETNGGICFLALVYALIVGCIIAVVET